jgi:nicotinate-nucleotide pyrophosphorylase (carboxylating)
MKEAGGIMLPQNRCPYREQLLHSIRALSRLAREEDLPGVDLTCRLLGKAGKRTRARILTRELVVFCGGLWLAELCSSFLGEGEDVPGLRLFRDDGAVVEAGACLVELAGDAASILALERTLLNFLGRSIGIASATYGFVQVVRAAGLNTRILDTRKTLPGYRFLDKYAVLCGGGGNHRMSLSDQILLKENHLAELGGIGLALDAAFAAAGGEPFLVEVRTMDELAQALERDCPIVMLDNFTPEQVHQACTLPRKHSQLEVSGGISLANIGAYLHPRLDRISIGGLTHSVKAPDLTLLVEEA